MWWKHPSVFANGWYQKLTRTVDPGFHSLRFNSLEIERVPPPAQQAALLFRDFFNRDDSHDINTGLTQADHWVRERLSPAHPDVISSEIYKTALTLTGPRKGKGVVGLVQQRLSPQRETIRYSTRVSLYTGEGSRLHSGIQEAGLLLLSEPAMVNEFHSTFVGVAYDRSRRETPGWVKYRVGNGRDGYRTNSEIPDTSLPFKVTEGEYEIIVEHDVGANMLSRIQINGVDITGHWAPPDRRQRISRGWFGIRALIDAHGSGVRLQQFYWYYRVEEDRRSP
jgi:hypothetical protein